MSDKIALTVNGERLEVATETTVAALVESMGIRGPVAVERNRVLIPRARHAETTLSADDVVEIVHFVGGG